MQPREVLQVRKRQEQEKEMLLESLQRERLPPSVVLLEEKPTEENLPELQREEVPLLKELLQQEKAGELEEEMVHLREELQDANLLAEPEENHEEADADLQR
jgi:hypothetical protein|tara:strand:+ start:255 stop:560 length:306 start_codon:yes stop_codon:yes gene_type:complete